MCTATQPQQSPTRMPTKTAVLTRAPPCHPAPFWRWGLVKQNSGMGSSGLEHA